MPARIRLRFMWGHRGVCTFFPEGDLCSSQRGFGCFSTGEKEMGEYMFYLMDRRSGNCEFHQSDYIHWTHSQFWMEIGWL